MAKAADWVEARFADRRAWLVLLAAGWCLGSPHGGLPVADVAPGHHDQYSVMLWRSVDG